MDIDNGQRPADRAPGARGIPDKDQDLHRDNLPAALNLTTLKLGYINATICNDVKNDPAIDLKKEGVLGDTPAGKNLAALISPQELRRTHWSGNTPISFPEDTFFDDVRARPNWAFNVYAAEVQAGIFCKDKSNLEILAQIFTEQGYQCEITEPSALDQRMGFTSLTLSIKRELNITEFPHRINAANWEGRKDTPQLRDLLPHTDTQSIAPALEKELMILVNLIADVTNQEVYAKETSGKPIFREYFPRQTVEQLTSLCNTIIADDIYFRRQETGEKSKRILMRIGDQRDVELISKYLTKANESVGLSFTCNQLGMYIDKPAENEKFVALVDNLQHLVTSAQKGIEPENLPRMKARLVGDCPQAPEASAMDVIRWIGRQPPDVCFSTSQEENQIIFKLRGNDSSQAPFRRDIVRRMDFSANPDTDTAEILFGHFLDCLYGREPLTTEFLSRVNDFIHPKGDIT